MSLRQALEKIRTDIGKENQNHCSNDNVSLEFQAIEEFDFDFSNEFFEQVEHWDTSTPLQAAVSQCTTVSASDNTKTDRIPLMQVCDQTPVRGDKSFDLSRSSLPASSTSLPNQKLKRFAFSRISHKEATDSGGLPPSKKPAVGKELKGPRHTPFNPSSASSSLDTTPLVDSQITTVTNPASLVCSTPTTTSNTNCNNEVTSLPVTPLSRSRVKRKFPGPAGLLPKLLPNQSFDDVKLFVPVSPGFTPRSKVTTLVDLLSSSQGDNCDFSGPVWKSAVEDLALFNSKNTQEITCISEVLKGRQLRRDHKGVLLEKVPFLVVMLKSLVPQGNGACVTLKDSTGEIPGTLHSRVYDEYESELIPGTVLILKKVSLFSPSQRRRYINITINNILKLYLQNGNVVSNEQVKDCNTVTVNSTLHSSPEDDLIPKDNKMDSGEMFNTSTDIGQEWCGLFSDTITTTSMTTVVVTASSSPVCPSSCTISSSTSITSITSATYGHVGTCMTHNNSITSQENRVQTLDDMKSSAASQFTDGLEDEDLDSLLRDFEEDHLLCT